ncbi:hypothetical protein NDU88_004143 [Pleurodeles waltl]|uniref:Uncharacterized protein n=1 Tax=Pleurodeles waltl TaxID=8319 RepID=A0AAV7M7C0_PLEWA|nr:hypothetical protein NDU88_004143 [Pleurodeles waltl]
MSRSCRYGAGPFGAPVPRDSADRGCIGTPRPAVLPSQLDTIFLHTNRMASETFTVAPPWRWNTVPNTGTARFCYGNSKNRIGRGLPRYTEPRSIARGKPRAESVNEGDRERRSPYATSAAHQAAQNPSKGAIPYYHYLPPTSTAPSQCRGGDGPEERQDTAAQNSRYGITRNLPGHDLQRCAEPRSVAHASPGARVRAEEIEDAAPPTPRI